MRYPIGHLSFRRGRLRFGPTVCRLAGAAIFACVAGVTKAAGESAQITTTVYVGRHFEVRDHDQPVKYVFNGDVRVARITGSLSASIRIQRLRLRTGWNLVSLAVTAPNALDQLALDADGTSGAGDGWIEAAFQWDPQAAAYSAVQSGQTLTAGTVVWLQARADRLVGIRGDYLQPPPALVPAGGGFTAGPGTEAWPLQLPPGVTIWKFDAATANWRAGFTGDLTPVSDLPPTVAVGEAIYVHTTASTELLIPDPAQRALYYHPDHLESSSVITDATGTLAEETAYYPFGVPRHEERFRNSETHYQFAQKERDRESGLHQFEARYLAAHFARFTTPDPLAADVKPNRLMVPQTLNPYAYANHNPLRFTDPTGLDAESVIGAVTRWGTKASPLNIAVNYVKVHFASFHNLSNVKKTAQAGQQLLRQADSLEKGARALHGATREISAADLSLPAYPLMAGDKAGSFMVSAAELDYVRSYFNTTRRIAGEARAARAELDQAIAGWDAVVRQATQSRDFTRQSSWDAITALDRRFGKEGGSFRAYLVDARDVAARTADWAWTKQIHAAHILGEPTPESYQPPTPHD